ncbi:hypothetical protein M0R19_03300 [Candidatus Pacearchaeota archaeon]|jgi:hypothetical protein|nr:hypothetical protein [Candidatus Pacearchaeota archaeon]
MISEMKKGERKTLSLGLDVERREDGMFMTRIFLETPNGNMAIRFRPGIGKTAEESVVSAFSKISTPIITETEPKT